MSASNWFMMALCSQTSLLMIIWICSNSLASLPQLQFRSSGIRFSLGTCNLDPSHAPLTVGFRLFWESNAATDLTGGRVQAVTWVMGSGCKYRWGFAHLLITHLLLCGPVANRPQTGSSLCCGLRTQALHHLPGQGGSVPQSGLKAIPVMCSSPKNALWEGM